MDGKWTNFQHFLNSTLNKLIFGVLPDWKMLRTKFWSMVLPGLAPSWVRKSLAVELKEDRTLVVAVVEVPQEPW